MRTLILTLAAAALSGCAAPKPYTTADGRQSQTDFMQCGYEADKAVIGIRSTLEQSFTRADLIDKCMAIRGLRQR